MFGSNGTDYPLRANEPFNGDGKCLSLAEFSIFNIFKEGGLNMLTNNKDGAFTISELEVWEVKK
jgi:hypothetical protein